MRRRWRSRLFVQDELTSCGRGQGEVSYLAADATLRGPVCPCERSKEGPSSAWPLSPRRSLRSRMVRCSSCCAAGSSAPAGGGVRRSAGSAYPVMYLPLSLPPLSEIFHAFVSPPPLPLSRSLSLSLDSRPRRTDDTAQKAKVDPCALRSAYPDGSLRSVGVAGATCVGGVGVVGGCVGLG